MPVNKLGGSVSNHKVHFIDTFSSLKSLKIKTFPIWGNKIVNKNIEISTSVQKLVTKYL